MNHWRHVLVCVLGILVLLVAETGLAWAQDAPRSIDREIYDNEEIFQQLSSAGQMRLERMFGRKVRPSLPLAPSPEVKPLADGPVNGDPSLSLLSQVLVNNAAADATAQDTQSETAIVLGSGGRIIVGFNDSGSFISPNASFTGWSRSDDGGASFTDQGRLPASANSDFGDPVLARSTSTGTIFYSTLSNSGNILQIFRSTNNGTSFNAPINGTPGFTGGSHDKQWNAVDNFAGTGQGTVYMIWRNFGSQNNGINFTRSVDDGLTWTPSGALNLNANGGQGAYVAVGPNHDVYAFWYHSQTTPDELRFRRSTDRGVSFAAPITITTLRTRGVNGDFGLGFRSNAFPHAAVNPVSGVIYLVYADSVGDGSDRCDVYFTQSNNLGSTWSAPVSIDNDFSNNDNWMPTLAIRPDGTGLSVTWYDRRGDPANNQIERWGRIASLSGTTTTWGPAFKISDPFPPVFGVDPVVNSTYMGDYDMMAADNNFYYTVWGDNRDQSIAVPSRKNANVRFAKYSSDAFLEITSTQISGGNGDKVVDVNECNGLSVTLRNNGGAALTGLTGTLVSLTPGVEILNATQTYPDVIGGASTTNSAPFLVSTNRSLVCNTMIDLRLQLSWTGGSETQEFDIPLGGYSFTVSSGTQPLGTTSIGLNGDDLVVPVNLPFPVTLYKVPYTTAYVSSNGNIQFESNSVTFTNACPGPQTGLRTAVMPYFDDLITTTGGVWSATSGTAPNRQFVLEWRAITFGSGLTTNFSVRFYENSPGRVDFYYGTVNGTGANATVGVQYGTGFQSLFSCNSSSLTTGQTIIAQFVGCNEGTGTCLPPDIALSPTSFSFTAPQNGSVGGLLTVRNTAAAGNDNLDFSVGDYGGTLLLSSGETIPVEIKRQMGVFPHEEPQKEVTYSFPSAREAEQRLRTLPSSATAFGTATSGGAEPASPNAADLPYVETFEAGNFYNWFNEGKATSLSLALGSAAEGDYHLREDASAASGHFSALRQNWSPAIQPTSVEFWVRPESPTTNAQGYFVMTTGAPNNTEVIWFYANEAGKLYVNGDLASGDTSVAYTQGTWYRIEFRDINWVAKNFDYYVNGVLRRANISFRNAGTVTNVDRLHLYNWSSASVAGWDGIRVGGQGPADWLAGAPSGGVLPPGGSSDLVISAKAQGLSPGSYIGRIVVSSNDPDERTLSVPVSFTVTPTVTPTEFGLVVDNTSSALYVADLVQNAMYGPYVQGGLGGTIQPLDVVVTPDRRVAMVSSFSPGRVFFVDIDPITTPTVFDTVDIVGSTAEDLALTRDGRFLLVTGGGGNTLITVINAATRAIVTTLNISPRTAESIEVGPDGTVLAASYGSSLLHVFRLNLSTGALTDPATAIAVASGPVNSAISPDGRTALVSCYNSGTIRAFSITGPGVLVAGSTFSVPEPSTIQFRPDGQFARVFATLGPRDSLVEARITGPGAAALTGAKTGLAGNTFGAYFGVDAVGYNESGTKALNGNEGNTVLAAAALSNLPSSNFFTLLPVLGNATGVATAGTASAGSDFATNLTVFDNCNTQYLRLGTAAGAGPGFDAAFDQFAPPAPPVGAFDARLRSPNDDFLRDFRATTTTTTTWRVLFAAQTGCGNVTVAWAINQLPTNGTIRLRDAFGGLVVDLDMRTASSYTVTSGLTELQIVHTLELPFSRTYAASWNLVGLPGTVPNPLYTQVFTAGVVPNTLFGFNGAYFLEDSLQYGKGYWLRFSAATPLTISNTFLGTVNIPMLAGWNLITSASCDKPRTLITDPGGIIVPNTLFGFNGAYFLSDTVKRGYGYWLRTTAAGTITITCPSPGAIDKPIAAGPVEEYPTITITDAAGASAVLHTGVAFKTELARLSYSMPPVPPAGSFDARFSGDMRGIAGAEGIVRLQAGEFPLQITASAGSEYVLVEMIGTTEGATHALSGGASVQIADRKVDGFRLRRLTADVPAEFVVDQNFPNPFNPSTEIRYGIPAEANVSVVVYNALGQAVKTLVDGNQKAGYYTVRWDADNEGGQKVGSGVYFYKVVAGQSSTLKKMLLLK